MKATIRGTELYFDIAGMQLAPEGSDFKERPVLFLLHGGPGGDHLRYKQTVLELQQCAQLVFIDHRGCGRSKKTRRADYTLENNIEDIEALRCHLGLERIALLGTSYGGVVAQGYAIRYPKKVEKLILAVTAPSFRFLEEAKQNIKSLGSPEQIAICEHLWKGSFKNPAHLQRFFQLMEPIYSVKAAKKSKKGFGKGKTVWSHEAINEGFGGFLRHYDYISQLKKIACPTLVLAGAKDWICTPAQSRIIAKHIRAAKLRIFKNCGHALSLDAHQSYIREIKKFLRAKA